MTLELVRYERDGKGNPIRRKTARVADDNAEGFVLFNEHIDQLNIAAKKRLKKQQKRQAAKLR